MIKISYICLTVATAAIITLSSCSSTPTAENPSAPVATPQVTEAAANNSSHSGHGGKEKININTAILSELDKFEAKLGIPALSNKIQANRPYGSPEDLVTKKVITQEQFDQIKDQVGVQDVVLTGEAKDVDYMSKLGLMKGHLLVAKELLDQNQPKQAEPHIGHPVEEIYVDVEDQLNERKVKEFKTTLVSLQDLVKSSPKDSKVKTNFTSSVAAVDTAIAALPPAERSQPGFVLQVINELLDAANSEYGAAIADGKISAAIEYQDSRGFVTYANELYKGISSQVAQQDPEADKVINTSFAELIKVWPAAIPPAKPVKTPEDVTKLVKTIEENSQKVIDKSSSQVQR
ncbi:MAG: helix-hairpin-helix domain-containing protein [Nostoc sp. ChiQUE01a]|nr:helix-hairpin-helix domain-containing protein [Nostoc sp. DedQUE11]MDZ8237725.1 helix-hairpin-helix domain-containing protein [Nostoc sp. ChiQUE01a]